MNQGLFITFEGGDGAGKSTQINLLKSELLNQGYDVIFLREPGGTDISEQIRQIILDPRNSAMTPVTEAFLYAAARAQLVETVIKPAIHDGKIVICDRFVDSSMAYQAYGRFLGEMVWDINQYAVDSMMPDLTFLLKVSPDKGNSRIQERELDRMERESMDFHNRVYEGYLELENKFPDRIIGIPADDTIEHIFNIIKSQVYQKLEPGK